MAEYQLTATDTVIRTEDGASIPADPENRDYNNPDDPLNPGYLQWVEDGGVADPYVPPEPAPSQPTPGEEVLFDHENRLRTIEGEPLLEREDFVKKLSGGG